VAPISDDIGLRERRAAFAALQSFAPQSKASKRTSLAITAAQREIVRAAARSKEEAVRERYSEFFNYLHILIFSVALPSNVFLKVVERKII
jgi:ABC-type amino acid transport system permease subunit